MQVDTKPRPVKIVSLGMMAIALVHLADIVLFWTFHGELTNSLAKLYPTLTQAQINGDVNNLLIEGIVPHFVFAALLVSIAVMMQKGKRWTRRAGTIILTLDILAAFFAAEVATLLPQEAVYIGSVVIFAVALQLACIALLWVPRSSKVYFSRTSPRKK